MSRAQMTLFRSSTSSPPGAPALTGRLLDAVRVWMEEADPSSSRSVVSLIAALGRGFSGRTSPTFSTTTEGRTGLFAWEGFTGLRPRAPEGGWKNAGLCVGPLPGVRLEGVGRSVFRSPPASSSSRRYRRSSIAILPRSSSTVRKPVRESSPAPRLAADPCRSFSGRRWRTGCKDRDATVQLGDRPFLQHGSGSRSRRQDDHATLRRPPRPELWKPSLSTTGHRSPLLTTALIPSWVIRRRP